MKKKIVYIISDIDRALGFEDIHTFLKDKFDFTFILLNKADSYFELYCHSNYIACYRITYLGKKSMIPAFFKTRKLLKELKPDIVHTHLLDASLIGLTAAKFASIKERIHTRHHSDFHHIYFPHAIKYDRYINSISHKIIAVSDSVKNILIKLEGASKEKIVTIHHGFKTSEFTNINLQRVNTLQEKYNPQNKFPVIGVISRYTEWKGIQNIIPAFKELLKTHPNALLVLANAKGAYKQQINVLLKDLPKESYQEIAFEHDLHALYKLFSVFIHVPITSTAEAFGQVYIEALLAKVPSIYTKSGIANEFDNKVPICIFVKSENNISEIIAAVNQLLENKYHTLKMTEHAFHYASQNFTLEHQMIEFEKLYNSI